MYVNTNPVHPYIHVQRISPVLVLSCCYNCLYSSGNALACVGFLLIQSISEVRCFCVQGSSTSSSSQWCSVSLRAGHSNCTTPPLANHLFIHQGHHLARRGFSSKSLQKHCSCEHSPLWHRFREDEQMVVIFRVPYTFGHIM